MKKLLLISALLLCSNGWAYNETDLAKFKALNVCEGCDLSGANLNNAQLSEANLRYANLRGAKLNRAYLLGANLYHADLRGADLSEANLSEVNLRGADLAEAKLDGAKYCKTQMPWGEVNDDCENAELGGTGFQHVLRFNE